MDSSKITALVLAGGRATRMDGQDKGLLEIDGLNIALRITRALASQVSHITINANRNIESYKSLGYPVVEDTLENFQGPLAGMAAGIQAMETDWLLTAPCDGPFIAEDYAKRMLQQALGQNCLLAVASDGHRLQPVYALIHKKLLPSLEQYLSGDDRKIDRWYHQQDFAEVVFADSTMFININTPEQLAEVTAQIRQTPQ